VRSLLYVNQGTRHSICDKHNNPLHTKISQKIIGTEKIIGAETYTPISEGNIITQIKIQ